MQNTLRVYEICEERGIEVSNVLEVGPFLSMTCQARNFIRDGKNVLLVEPQPIVCAELKRAFKDHLNVRIVNCAIADFNGDGEMALYGRDMDNKRRASSHLMGYASDPPTAVGIQPTVKPEKFIYVPCRTIDRFDNGRFDAVMLDIEGMEWHALRKLKSRPKIISIETLYGKTCKHYHYEEIYSWMEEKKYVFVEQNSGDSIWVRK